MTKFSLLILIFTLTISCGMQQNNIPDNIMTKEQIIPILIDIHIAEASFQERGLQGDSLIQNAKNYYTSIYKKHNITEKLFKESFDFYAKNINIMDEIYVIVIEELSKMEGEYYTGINTSKVDSTLLKLKHFPFWNKNKTDKQ